jgi:hypothetical protein
VGHIEQPVLPSRLYRYRSLTRDKNALDQEIEAIRKNYLWCSDFTKMNDPMEGFYRPSRTIQGRPNYNKIVKLITAKKSSVGIACLSDTRENVLMWTHYAGNYQGICVSYSSRVLVEGLPLDSSLVRLGYDDDPPRIASADIRNPDKAARIILSQKKYNWAYEREWRVMGSKGAVPLGIENAVRSVYLGSRIDPKHRHKLSSKLQGTGIKIFSMEVDGYDHTWAPANAVAKKSNPDE